MKHFEAYPVMPGVIRINTLNGLGPEEINHSKVIRDLSVDEALDLVWEILESVGSAQREDT